MSVLDSCKTLPCFVDVHGVFEASTTETFRSITGSNCLRFRAVLDQNSTENIGAKVNIVVSFRPMCSSAMLLDDDFSVTRSMLTFGEVVDSLYSDLAIKVNPGEVGGTIALDGIVMQNVNSAMLVTDGQGQLLLEMNVTDPSRSARIFFPASAYTDMHGNSGAGNQTLTLHPILTQQDLTQQAKVAQITSGAASNCFFPFAGVIALCRGYGLQDAALVSSQRYATDIS
jgi:hypothetical protein